MKIDVGLQMKMGQHLVMTPQLQQAIKLLQLSRYELEQLVNQSLVENPALEIAANTPDEDQETTKEDIFSGNEDTGKYDEETWESQSQDWEEGYDYDHTNQIQTSNSKDDDDGKSILENTLSYKRNIWDFLTEQLELLELDDDIHAIGEQLIGNIDDDGYLNTSIRSLLALDKDLYTIAKRLYDQEAITINSNFENHKFDLCFSYSDKKEERINKVIKQNNEESEEKKTASWIAPEKVENEICSVVEKILQKIQKFEPAGVGARSLQECLLIQLSIQKKKSTVEFQLVEQHMDLLVRKDIAKISRKFKIDQSDAIEKINLITSLEPKPGRPFHNETIQYIIPDVYIIRRGKSFAIQLNNESLPRLQLSHEYLSLNEEFQKKKDAEKTERAAQAKAKAKAKKEAENDNGEEDLTGQYLTEKIKAGEWLIKSIEQRQKTILKVAESILKHQHEFFLHGIDSLKPMVLKDVADDISVHESTVSRITTNKYVHTPQGIFELKFFFTSGILQKDGETISSKKIKDIIKNLIQEEAPNKPYTDSQIAKKLEEKETINIARRTVAKYREALNILPSNRRKKIL